MVDDNKTLCLINGSNQTIPLLSIAPNKHFIFSGNGVLYIDTLILKGDSILEAENGLTIIVQSLENKEGTQLVGEIFICHTESTE